MADAGMLTPFMKGGMVNGVFSIPMPPSLDERGWLWHGNDMDWELFWTCLVGIISLVKFGVVENSYSSL